MMIKDIFIMINYMTFTVLSIIIIFIY